MKLQIRMNLQSRKVEIRVPRSLLANPVFVPVVVVDFGFHSFIFYRPPSSLRMEAPCRRLLTLFVPLCLVLMWM